jgi:hypothetical protein
MFGILKKSRQEKKTGHAVIAPGDISNGFRMHRGKGKKKGANKRQKSLPGKEKGYFIHKARGPEMKEEVHSMVSNGV